MCIGLCRGDVRLGWSANFVDINDLNFNSWCYTQFF